MADTLTAANAITSNTMRTKGVDGHHMIEVEREYVMHCELQQTLARISRRLNSIQNVHHQGKYVVLEEE